MLSKCDVRDVYRMILRASTNVKRVGCLPKELEHNFARSHLGANCSGAAPHSQELPTERLEWLIPVCPSSRLAPTQT